MTGEERQTLDVLDQGADRRRIRRPPIRAVITLLIVVVALASGLLWWSHGNASDRPTPSSTRPLLASPLAANGWNLDAGGRSWRLAVAVTNVGVHAMRIHGIHLAPESGVTTDWVGLATEREMRYLSAEGFTPHRLGRGFELRPGESTHLVASMHIDCAALTASPTPTVPTFQIDYTAVGFRRTQYFEQSLDSGSPTPSSSAAAWGCRP